MDYSHRIVYAESFIDRYYVGDVYTEKRYDWECQDVYYPPDETYAPWERNPNEKYATVGAHSLRIGIPALLVLLSIY